MKKCFLFLVALGVSVMTMAQHMTFKGVEIDGPLENFVKAMVAEGFELVAEEDGIAVLKGNFAGYRDCEVAVMTFEGMDVVNAVGVMFHQREEWSAIENDYNSLKAMLTEKYGLPYRVVEEFNGRVFDDNRTKFYYLTSDRCKWASIFETENGTIELYMQQTDYDKAAVVIKYYDGANTEAMKASALEDL